MKKSASLVALLMVAVMLCACGTGSDLSSDNSSASFTLGKVVDNQYTNEFLGITCTLDEQWTFYTDEQIKKVNNITADMLDEDIAAQLENANFVYDMMASSESGASVSVNIENLGLSGVAMTAETYLSMQIDTLKTSLEQMGFSNVVIENKTYDFAGNSEEGVYVHASVNGVIFEEAVVVLKRGMRFANISVGTVGGDIDSILAMFEAL